ncbi:MAG: UDP-N-acetylmuramate dehydrogenase [Lachnospiraceae bacterium]|nr:UDP-N-acetylmuramate dehydrogenase [Lachnospiraceae bacterium]
MAQSDWKTAIQSIHPSERLFFDEPMAKHTTFRIGGPAECYAVTDDGNEVRALVSFCKEQGVPYHIIGNGSNLLVSDDGIEGLVIRMEGSRISEEPGADGKVHFRVSAGTLLSGFAKGVCKDGYTGLEFATGIPGSVGGAVVMNAGAYGGEIKDRLVSADVLTKDGGVLTLTGPELELSYRHSNVTEREYIVLSAEFALEKGDPEAIKETVDELSGKRKDKQPLEYPSAGSTFKRPEGYFAGKLIDDCGLRGFTVGGAQVSEKHCGFVINRGGATAEDVLGLIGAVQKTVLDRFGILLEPEVRFLGF